MRELEVLIREFVSIDAFATSAIVVCKVTTLAHEVWDHTVKAAAFKSKSFLTSAESTEILWKRNVLLFRNLNSSDSEI